MKIAYIANARIPTEKAHGAQIMNTCAALIEAGAEVELIIPRRDSKASFDPFRPYGLEDTFKISRLFSIDLLRSGLYKPLAFALQTITFSISSLLSLKGRDVIIYGRDESVLALLSLFHDRIFWESHTGNDNIFTRILLKRAQGVVCISHGLADLYLQKGLDKSKVLVAADAVDMAAFDVITEGSADLRQFLGLPVDRSIVTYSGSIGLYTWKGVDVFLDSVPLVRDLRVNFLIIGGSDGEIAKLKQERPDERIIFIGRMSHDKIPRYLKASDVLVIPNKAGSLVSEKYTSPMKLFEYMASRKVIVASDLPSIREVIDDADAIFFRPNDARDLAQKIEGAISDSLMSQRKADGAYEKARRYTWRGRASNILDFIRR
ncbi:MAG: glycosyltransferase family 4 protein [Candidatus Paceibacterota bacterium]|jgi:glycosyltransferase involved in cell wall biosynthesis